MTWLPDVGGRSRAIVSLAATAITIGALSFRTPPIGEARALALGAFLALVPSGLIYVAMIRWPSRQHLVGWVAAAAIGALGFFGTQYFYGSLWDRYVGIYGGEQRVVGDEYTAEGLAWVAKERVTDPTQLLFDAGGLEERLWKPDGIQRVKDRMRLTFYAGAPLLSLGVLATLQSVYCVALSRRRPAALSPASAVASSSSDRPAGTHEWDFFIAHAGADAEVAEELYDLLAPHCRVFLDSRCLVLGDDWDTKLAAAQKASLVTVVLVSSRTGMAYYEREEIAAAVAMARAASERHRVVPLYLDPAASASDGVPYGLRLKHGLQIAGDVTFADCANELRLLANRIGASQI